MRRFALLAAYALGLVVVCLLPAMAVAQDESRGANTGAQDYFIVEVQAGETLYALSIRYKVDQARILEANPSLQAGMRAGMRLRIPRLRPQANTEAEYTLHQVRRGETLSQLSRRYGVSVGALRRANAIQGSDLTVDALVRIPSQAQARVYDSLNRLEANPVQSAGTERITHPVQAGETLYGIARRYGLTVEALEGANPTLAQTGLQPGMELLVPTGQSLQAGEEVGMVRAQQPARHPVQAGETLYGIARRYGLTVEALEGANPTLAQTGLQPGMELVIPGRGWPSGLEQRPRPIRDERMCERVAASWNPTRKLSVALLLPFSTGQAPDERSKLPPELGGKDLRFFEFYQGFLLALSELRDEGFQIRLRVFDTRNRPEVAERIVQGDSLRGVQLIFGPVYPRSLVPVANYAARQRIPLVSPLSPQALGSGMGPYFFQANPSDHMQLRRFVQEAGIDRFSHLVVIRERSVRDLELADNLQLMLQSQIAMLPGSGPRVGTVELDVGSSLDTFTQRVAPFIAPNSRTAFFVPSTSEPFISDVLGLLTSWASVARERPCVFGMSRWAKLEKLDYKQLSALEVRIFSPFYTQYEDPRTIRFVEEYRANFRAEPSQYALQGYDLAQTFIRAHCQYGPDFRHCLHRVDGHPLQNRFDFVQMQESGPYVNQGIFLLQFSAGRGLVPPREEPLPFWEVPSY